MRFFPCALVRRRRRRANQSINQPQLFHVRGYEIDAQQLDEFTQMNQIERHPIRCRQRQLRLREANRRDAGEQLERDETDGEEVEFRVPRHTYSKANIKLALRNPPPQNRELFMYFLPVISSQ